jgi:hypothetical protein
MLHAWERRIVHVRYWWESHREIDHWEDLDINGKLILNGFQRNMMGWFELAQNKGQWRTFVNTVMYCLVP